ncbi:MAG: hypothetical protein ACI9MC_002794 [Kiritimatiellia bacterium]|jgi:hypothetical protein
MNHDELERFLKAVDATQLVDYLDPDGETAEQALDRKLRWAAMVRQDTRHSAEAAFLLRHQDALRHHTLESSDDLEEEWIEFAEAGEEGGFNVWSNRAGQRDTNLRTEAVSLFTPLPAPTHQADQADQHTPTQRVTPDRDTARAATVQQTNRLGITNPGSGHAQFPPTPDSTPTPAAGPGMRDVRPHSGLSRARASSPRPAHDRNTPSPPVIARMREVTPVPSVRTRTRSARPPNPMISRLSPAPSPTRTPAGRGPRASSVPPPPVRTTSSRPAPSRWSTQPAPSRAPSPASAPPGTPGAHSPRYSPPSPRAPSPRADTTRKGFDVRIAGSNAGFVRANDQYGQSEVVYESEFAGQSMVPPPSRHGTPHSIPSIDILGSLRSTSRSSVGPDIRTNAPRRRLPVVTIALSLAAFSTIGIAGYFGVATGIFSALMTPIPNAAVNIDAPINAFSIGTPLQKEYDDQPEIDVPTVAPGPDTVAAVTRSVNDGSTLSNPGTNPTGQQTTSPGGQSATMGRPTTRSASTSPNGSQKTRPNTGSRSNNATRDKDTSSDTVAAASDPDTETETEAPVVVGILSGNWKCTVGGNTCIADLKQKDQSLRGTISVWGEIYRVTGRYNEVKGSIRLEGDGGVMFRGMLNDDRINGTARLGAGAMQQPWNMSK